jgi:hypothetical protein
MVRKYEEENLRRPSPTGAYHFQVSVKAESADIPIAPAILREAVELVAARQHVLRSTVFDHETGRMQALHLARAVDFELIDASGCTGPEQDAFIDKLMAADRRSPVDLRADNAVFRIKVVQWSPNAVDAVFACHHGFGDGWGGHELLSNVFRVYESLSAGNRAELDRRLASAGPKNNVYKEFVALEESQWRDERAKKFWEQYLGEIAHARFDTISSVFPTDAPAPIVRSVDPSIVARLNEFSRSRRLSMRAILLSAYLDVVQRLTPDEPTAIGVVTNGRSERLSDPLGAFGLLWQFLPVAVPGVKGAVAKAHAVHERLRTVEALGGYPLHRLLHEAGRPEPFSATFSFVRFPNAPWAAHDIKLGVRRRKTFDRYHFPLNASLEALGEAPASSVIRSTVPNLRATFTYSPLHFHEESIERVASSFLAKLSEIAGTF